MLYGIDEVGRGPLAGPVVSACMVFFKPCTIEGIKDSKQLSEKKREKFYDAIIQAKHDHELAFGIGIVDVETIDAINILQATLLSMQLAYKNCPKSNISPNTIIYVDGNQGFEANCQVIPVIKGDQSILEISTASIIAKVTRDRLMNQLAKQHPEYSWDQNKGYGTKVHLEAINQYGLTRHHRKTFLKTYKKDCFLRNTLKKIIPMN